MTKEQMIKALALSKNEVVATKCRKILNNETTIEEELKYCGSFMKQVLVGNYDVAIKLADPLNLHALKIFKEEVQKIKQSSIEWLLSQIGEDVPEEIKKCAKNLHQIEIQQAYYSNTINRLEVELQGVTRMLSKDYYEQTYGGQDEKV